MRTELTCMIKSAISGLGLDLGPSGASHTFHKRIADMVPAKMEDAIAPLLPVLESTAVAVAEFDRRILRVSKEHFEETAVLRQIDGVGPTIALTFAATIEDPNRFNRSRGVGAYAGLAPRSRSSCDSQPELSISRRGDAGLRKALVNAATFITSARGKDCDLKRWGKALQHRGGQRSKAKARIAVARKLAVLMHRLMLTSEVYEPDRHVAAAAA